jgi:hypothetical protein
MISPDFAFKLAPANSLLLDVATRRKMSATSR